MVPVEFIALRMDEVWAVLASFSTEMWVLLRSSDP
jgi:hypothetical protein